MIKKRIRIPIYHGYFTMIHCTNWIRVNQRYKVDIQENWDGVFFTNDDNEYVIAFKGSPKGSVIAHEIVHLVNQIYVDKVMKLDPENDEPQAYLTEFFFEEIETFINKQNTEIDSEY